MGVLDYSTGAPPIWVITDASKVGTGAVLCQGDNWRTATPIAFTSSMLNAAERNYPVHEQELLAIHHALQHWRHYLLGVSFRVLSDHQSLRDLKSQKHLSGRQARWMEFFSEFDMDITHIPGHLNYVSDYLSRYTFFSANPNAHLTINAPGPVPAIHVLHGDPDVTIAMDSSAVLSKSLLVLDDLLSMKAAYSSCKLCSRILSNMSSFPDFSLDDRQLLRFKTRFVVPNVPGLRHKFLHDAHDVLAHPGFNKTIRNLSAAVFWPTMHDDCHEYCRSCEVCQWAKDATSSCQPPIRMLPIPEEKAQHIAVDFIGPLCSDAGFDNLLTITDRIGGVLRLVPGVVTDTAVDVAKRFYDSWVREFGIPLSIVCDHDKLWTSNFWRALNVKTGTRLDMSSAFHPKTDG